jgi:hypothetical protein
MRAKLVSAGAGLGADGSSSELANPGHRTRISAAAELTIDTGDFWTNRMRETP